MTWVHRSCAGVVGNTGATSSISARSAVHPRTRGKNKMGCSFHMVTDGSPPHTRGAVGPRSGNLLCVRFTSTYAGSSHHAASVCTVHPRTRGKYLFALGTGTSIRGSSPHAGKTRARSQSHRDSLVHPGTRGKNIGNGHTQYALVGSPRVRGKNAVFTAPICSVHPGTRGKADRNNGFTLGEDGSSPRVKRNRGWSGPDRHRFIPAHVGKTSALGRSGTASTAHPAYAGKTAESDFVDDDPTVHPCTRGKNDDPTFLLIDTRGSPPRTPEKRNRSNKQTPTLFLQTPIFHPDYQGTLILFD
jgi:hypothetical protein